MTAHPQDLFALFGGPVVLLEVRARTKRPIRTDWQKLTLKNMTPEYLAMLNGGCNVGVVLGKASRNLITIDFDDKSRWDQMLALNPGFSDTLISRGKRGGNVWLYIDGDYPASCDVKAKNDTKIAEFRANGRQTVIRGIHQTGTHYTNNGHTPISKRLDEIVWPDDAILPWKDAPMPDSGAPCAEKIADPLEAQLIAEWGAPFVRLQGSSVKINHSYFVHRFCLEHHILFETTEGAFHLYDDSTGAWQYVDTGVIKELMRADWLRISTAKGGNALSVMGTDTLLNHFVSGIRSASGKASAFKRLRRGSSMLATT